MITSFSSPPASQICMALDTMRQLRRFALIALLTGITNTGCAGMFEFLKKHDVFLWPETKGKLTLGGEPISGVTIVREVYYDKSTVETTTTSSTGSFSFRELSIRSRTPSKPFTEARTIQAITAEFRHDRYLLWAYATDSIVEEPLISEKLKDLACDLNNEERYHHFSRPDSSHLTYNIKGICR